MAIAATYASELLILKIKLAHPKGVEPLASAFGGQRSESCGRLPEGHRTPSARASEIRIPPSRSQALGNSSNGPSPFFVPRYPFLRRLQFPLSLEIPRIASLTGGNVMDGSTAFLAVTVSTSPVWGRGRTASHLHLIHLAAPLSATTHGGVDG